MNDILYSIKFEFKYLLKSKYLFLILISYLFIFMFLYNGVQSTKTSIDRYKYSLEQLTNSGVDVEEELKKEPNSTTMQQGDNQIEVDFGLSSMNEDISKQIYNLKPEGFAQGMLEVGVFIVFPIVFCIIASIVLGRDYETGVIRIKSSNRSWGQIVIGQILFILILLSIFIISFTIISYLISLISQKFYMDSLDTSLFKDYILEKGNNIILNILIAIIISMVFISLISILTVTLKQKFFGIIAILLYNLIVPILGKYDLKAILINIVNNNYSYVSGNLVNVEKLNITFCYGISILVILIAVFFIYLLANKQSKYN